MLQSLLTALPVLLLASKAVISEGVVVEVSKVTNVEVTASGWDLRSADDGGCGVVGCDPRLTRDGLNNTVSDSRWSCTDGVSAANTDCTITYTFDTYFTVSHAMLYFHESDVDTGISIPFSANSYDTYTVPGTPLGEGQQVNLSTIGYSSSYIRLDFDLTNGQWIHLSEVEIFVIVDDLSSIVVSEALNISYVDVRTVANVYAYASNWDLSVDAGCGEAGCDPRLASDGKNNTVAASRWSCSLAADIESVGSSAWDPTMCNLALQFDAYVTISHLIVYMHESNATTKAPVSMIVASASCSIQNGCSTSDSYNYQTTFETEPGTPLGEGQRVNLARPSLSAISIHPNISFEGQSVGISEVEIIAEVTETDVEIAAVEAWNTVTAEAATTVTVSATGSIDGFGPGKVADGHNNTVATSYWSCNLTVAGLGTTSEDFCGLSLELGDDYTLSYFILYVHDSDDATKDPIDFIVCDTMVDYRFCSSHYTIGAYSTTPGTALGEGERINLIRPYTNTIGIKFNITRHETIDIGEVELFLYVPDGSPTPSPFAGDSTYLSDDDSFPAPAIGSGYGSSSAPTSTMSPEPSTESPSDSGTSSNTTTMYSNDDGSRSTTAPTLSPEPSTESPSDSGYSSTTTMYIDDDESRSTTASTLSPEPSTESPSDSGYLSTTTMYIDDDESRSTTSSTSPPKNLTSSTSDSDSSVTATTEDDIESSISPDYTLPPDLVTDSHSGAKRAVHVTRAVAAIALILSLLSLCVQR